MEEDEDKNENQDEEAEYAYEYVGDLEDENCEDEDIEEVDEDEIDEDLEEALDPFAELIEIITVIGPANTIHTVSKFLEGLGPPYAVIAEKAMQLATRCARRHNMIIEVAKRRREQAESEDTNGEENKPTG